MTQEDFFHWLDYGAGKDISLGICPRECLDKEQVRYLSREERMNYLVMVDEEGRLCWKRNGIRIDTTVQWRDSIHGVVPIEDEAPEFSSVAGESKVSPRLDRSSSEASSNESSLEDRINGNAAGSVNEDLKGARRFKKSKEVGPAMMFEHLLMGPAKKSKWIIVTIHKYTPRYMSASFADETSWNNAGC